MGNEQDIARGKDTTVPVLTAVDIDNTMALLARVNLTGNEAKTYVGLELKFDAMRRAIIATNNRG